MAEPDTGWVHCPKHMAIEIPSEESFAGAYVKCENFNRMQELLESGRVDDAKKLVFMLK